MQIDRLILTNFGLYAGEHILDLRPAKKRPVILIGGVNGSGKTTLIDAVLLSLYGNRAKCSKRAGKSYADFLLESIHHSVNNGTGASVQLNFRYIAEGAEYQYEVRRSWGDAGHKIKERVEVKKNGLIDTWLSKYWHQIVEDIIPQGIAQLCFFDAEKIRTLAEDETTTKGMSEAIKSVLGLDLADRLITDSRVLEGRIVAAAVDLETSNEIRDLESNLNDSSEKIFRLVQESAGLENRRHELQIDLSRAEEKFRQGGGTHWENRVNLQNSLNATQLALNNSEERLFDLAATDLPLAQTKELLEKSLVQANKEALLVRNKAVVEELEKYNSSLISELKIEGTEKRLLAIVTKYAKAAVSQYAIDKDVSPRLALSIQAQNALVELVNKKLEELTSRSIRFSEAYEQDKRELDDLQRTLASIPKDEAIGELLEELRYASGRVADVEVRIERLRDDLGVERRKRDELTKHLTKLQRNIINAEIGEEEDLRIAKLLERTQDTMRAFLSQVTANKIDRFSGYVTDSFMYLLRKKTLVSKVLVDPDSFRVTLFDKSGNRIDKQRLSEGEKQLFAIALLWGLSQVSPIPLPAIIDTPMARLDAHHRNQLIDRYFPNASHQVIILSTDTEVEYEYFERLQPYIERAYHLVYDEETKSTNVDEGYFWNISEKNSVAGLAV